MRISTSQLRRIIKEEVANVRGARRARLSEGHARITPEEMAAWKRGNWGYISETFPAAGGVDEDFPPPEAEEDAQRLFCAKMKLCGPDEIEYALSGRRWECCPGLSGVMSHYWDDRIMAWVGIAD